MQVKKVCFFSNFCPVFHHPLYFHDVECSNKMLKPNLQLHKDIIEMSDAYTQRYHLGIDRDGI